jgi:protein phosphatase
VLRGPRSWALAAAGAVLLATLIAAGVTRRRRARPVARARVIPRIDVYGAEDRTSVIAIAPTPERARLVDVDSEAAHDPQGLPPLRIRSCGKTDIGRTKPSNQDSLLVREDLGLFVVADGIGGHAGGEVASATAVDVIEQALGVGTVDVGALAHLPRGAAELASAVYRANAEIRTKAARDWNVAEMGTTCVAARFAFGGHRLYVVHIGDSRVYRLRGGTLEQMTTDHTMANAGLDGARGAHLLTALGADACPTVDVLLASPRTGDIYLLCSDGLCKMVPTDELTRALSAPRPPLQIADDLIELANAHGGTDNITAIVVRLDARA